MTSERRRRARRDQALASTTSPERRAQTAIDTALATELLHQSVDDAVCRVSVVTTAYNAAETIEETLTGFAAQSLPASDFELVIVDDCSTDQTLQVAADFATHHPDVQVTIVSLSENIGAARARAVAINFVAGPLVAFFDADDVPNPDYLAHHLVAHDAHDGEPIVSCSTIDTLYFDDPSSTVASTVQASELNTIFGDVRWAGGGTVAMPVSVFELLAGYDPLMFGAEDLDFSVRAWLHSIPLVLAPGAVCYYRQRGTLKRTLHQRQVYGRGQVALVRKVWPLIDWKRYAYWQLRGIARLPRQLGSAAMSAARSESGRFAAVDRIGLISGYLSGSVSNRLFVLCPFGSMLRRPNDSFDLEML